MSSRLLPLPATSAAFYLLLAVPLIAFSLLPARAAEKLETSLREAVHSVPVVAAGASIVVTSFRPRGAGPFPWIVLSHGTAATPEANRAIGRYRNLPLTREWVRRGSRCSFPCGEAMARAVLGSIDGQCRDKFVIELRCPMVRFTVLVVFQLAAFVSLVNAAPDEDKLGKARAYPIGNGANWYDEESVRVGSFSHQAEIKGIFHGRPNVLQPSARPMPLAKAAQEPDIRWSAKDAPGLKVDDYLARPRITGLIDRRATL